MSDLYSKYFSEGDVYDGLGRIMYARKCSKISDKELCKIANELMKKGMIKSTSIFERKAWWSWNEKYVRFLMNGMSTGRVSRDYLVFYSEVIKGVRIKKIVGSCAILMMLFIIGIIIWRSFSDDERRLIANSVMIRSLEMRG